MNINHHPEKSPLTPPDGYRVNALGHMVPVAHVKPINLLRDELIDSLFTEARPLRRQLAEFKLRALHRIRDFVDLSAAEYGVNYGATKGNEACITKWSDGADAKLIAIVNRSFKVNKQGQIDINEVLALRDLDIDDEEWQEAMRAVSDSIKVSGSSTYLRFYQREADKAYKQLSLDISKL